MVVKLNSIKREGFPDIEEVREEISLEILNKKKGDLIIKDNSNIDTLEEFAAKNKLEIVTADALNQKMGLL